eukprot:2462730-Amphidinium_carterae.1
MIGRLSKLLFEWVAPTSHGALDATILDQGVVARSSGGRVSLLRVAAENAFGTIPKTGLKRLQRLIGSESESD